MSYKFVFLPPTSERTRALGDAVTAVVADIEIELLITALRRRLLLSPTPLLARPVYEFVSATLASARHVRKMSTAINGA